MHPAPLLLDAAACYAALCARDARFDGHWFVAVSTTGIYCRPVCRVRTPRAENCHFYAHAASAEAAGYRPCRRCRPELAPRAFSVVAATEQLAQAARERLDAGYAKGLPALAAELGITDRHLRRIFQAQLGVSPLQYQQTQRLLLAKALLTDSSLSVASVAERAGFGSTRAFHSAWARHYRLEPLDLRKAREVVNAQAELRLAFRPPYDVSALLQFLARRSIPEVELVDEQARRMVRAWPLDNGQWGSLAVRFESDHVRVELSPRLWRHPAAVVAGVRTWLDLDADPQAVMDRLRVAGLDATPGLRLPGCADRFELGIRAILGQQVTVAAARTLAQRLVTHFGAPLPEEERLTPNVTRRFPLPGELALLSAETLAATIRLPLQRARALIALAQAWPDLAYAKRQGVPLHAERELQGLSGIGPWTAAYLLMRGWPWPDRFLPGDVVLKQQLAAHPKVNTDAAAPYRSYAVLQLWRNAA
ncbi:Ada metal-binding domain-containing protein [Inhella gelatinilytica]|uniref:DNA-3-methyladenine glycosylase II n=1 Tax=Inhella gelatinilytica TaxID=2795030 RepID=A0A931IUE7_9BURK|nr:Ada metal-binding domain-containing protein [Inhella gelatinilytica]MBH9552967.1 helix-turn-helix domain-containing protein [Inhella gelatinilytica]